MPVPTVDTGNDWYKEYPPMLQSILCYVALHEGVCFNAGEFVQKIQILFFFSNELISLIAFVTCVL